MSVRLAEDAHFVIHYLVGDGPACGFDGGVRAVTEQGGRTRFVCPDCERMWRPVVRIEGGETL